MAKRIGNNTLNFEHRPYILGYGSVVGKKEHDGPLGDEFDSFSEDSRFGEKTFEKAESRLQSLAVGKAAERAGIRIKELDMIFAGDLLNQCIVSSFGLRDLGIPFIGIYGACSTMALGSALACLSLESGGALLAAAVTSSHFCSAERQYRFPLEYGYQRTPTAQWTVTGAGALIFGKNNGTGIYADKICFGKIVDLGVTDANNMGAAMAPAAADTITNFLKDTDTTPSDYDIIYTGDLGTVGTALLYDLCEREGYDLHCRHADCGMMIFDRKLQDVEAGGSGCGCSAAVLASFIMNRFAEGNFHNILFISTGALMSPTSSLQGESIPGIAHLINLKKD